LEFVKNRKAVPIIRDGKKTITTADTMSPDGIQARLDELQKELIQKANSKQDYDAIADEIFRLRGKKKRPMLHPEAKKTCRKESPSCRIS
jgi:hypothetical protein